MISKIIIILLFLSLPQPSLADYANGVKALQNFKYDLAYDEFLSGAKQGDIDSQYALGIFLIKKDSQQSFIWFNKAAVQGFAPAQYQLGDSYLLGRGIYTDIKAAINWYRKAAHQGYLSAQYQLGQMYNRNEGTS